MEDPNCVSIADIFVVLFLCALVESDGDLLLLLFGSGPGVEDGLLFEVEIVVLDFESLVDLDVEEGGGVEGDVGVDVLLVVEAGLEIEDAELAGDFEQFQNVLVGLFVFDVGEILGTVDVLQHEVVVVPDGELLLLVDEVVVLAQFELELVDEDLDLFL